MSTEIVMWLAGWYLRCRHEHGAVPIVGMHPEARSGASGARAGLDGVEQSVE